MNAMIIFFTAPNLNEAKKISQCLIEKKLVACASIIPKVFSIYEWEGKVEEAEEVKVIFKTHSSHFNQIEKVIHSLASYDVPEILGLKVEKGSKDYLAWMSELL